MIFDSHTHIQFPAYDADRDDVLARAKKSGVKMIVVGTQYSTSRAGIVLAGKYPNEVWVSIGFHPNHAVIGGWYHDPKEQKSAKPEIFDKKKFEELARHKSVVAIGECGLDYYRLPPNSEDIKEIQKKVFIGQIEIAQEVGKPLMIHARPSKGTDDAYEDMLQITSSLRQSRNIIHFYEGSFEMTKKLVEAGYYFTFGGIITWKRDYDDILAYIPLERILLETDAPYVAPAPYRGERNEPAYVVETAKKLAELTGKTFEEICQIILTNNKAIFGV